MTVIREMDSEAWDRWVAERPAVIQEMCRRLPPNRLYRLKSSGHRVTIRSYCEDGTVTVYVAGEYNRVVFSRHVFGVDPNDLVECELPAPGEDLGDTCAEAGLDEDDITNLVIPEIKRWEKQ